MAKGKNDFVWIDVPWGSFEPDSLQFKPGKPVLVPENVVISVPVPNTTKYIISQSNKDGKVVLTAHGMYYAIKYCKTAELEVEENYPAY